MSQTLHDTDTLLACPECGSTSVSWIVKQVQFGFVAETDDGHIYEEPEKSGPITADTIDEDGLFCTECAQELDRDELVPEDTNE